MSGTVEERLETRIGGRYDVIVVGGGVAGVGAALSAAREGAACLLLEKSVVLGGLATLGLITYYEPLCDGRGRKIIGGLAEELLWDSIRYGYDTLPEPWRVRGDRKETSERYHTHFNAASFVLALDERLRAAGVELLLDALFVRPIMEQGRCRAVVVEEKGGRVAYEGAVVVDASGDAEIFAKAGSACVEGRNWLTYCACVTSLDLAREAVEAKDIRKAVRTRAWGADRLGRGQPEDAPTAGGRDAREITDFVLRGRALALREIAASPGTTIITMPGMAQLRTIRRIAGCYTLSEADVSRRFEDSIGAVSDFSRAGPAFEVPFRALVNPGAPNLITAGRSIASEGHAWEVTRVIPPAVLTGQAAGTAAAMAAARGCPIAEVPLRELQERLAATGVLIHL